MKYIKMIEPIPLTNLNDKPFENEDGSNATISLGDFIKGRLSDPKFGNGVDSLISASQIKTAVDRASDYLELETKDWELLSDVVRNPSSTMKYNPVIAHCLVPVITAILGASDSKNIVD